MVLADYAISSQKEDKLGRSPLAKRVAEMVLGYKESESFVIGIDGPWGSGKTSFINLVLSEINPEEITLIKFNPWNFTGQNELINDFFSTLASKIETFRLDKEKSKKVKRIVSKLTRKSDIAFSPELGFAGGLVSFKANDLFKLNGSDKTLEEERKEIDELFQSLGKKVVIVIDDIDRLDSEETRLVMKLVKMTANFPNTTFLLAYDRARVAQQLSDKDTGFDGGEYLKKIVQVNFTLPAPEPEDLWDMLIADINSTLVEVYGKDDVDEDRWPELFAGGFSKLFRTIRDTKYYINSLRVNWKIMGGEEVNPIDFIAIEAIRVFAPEFYALMAGNESLFVERRNYLSGLSDADDRKARTSKYEELLQKVSETYRENINDICKKLFPQLEDVNYADDFEIRWRKESRVCSKDRFRYYFKLGIPRKSITNNEVQNLLKSLISEEDFCKNLKQYDKDKNLRKILARLLDHIDNLGEEKLKNLILAVWRMQEGAYETRENVWDFDDVDTSSERLVYHATKKNLEPSKRAAFVAEMVKQSQQVFPPIQFSRILIHEQERKGTENPDVSIPDSAGIVQLKKSGLDKIKTLIKENKLFSNKKRFIHLLYAWRTFGEESEMKKYVADLLKTKKGVLEFLERSVGLVLSSTGNYKAINKEDLAGLYPKEELEKKVSEITDEDLKHATQDQIEALDLFKNPRGHLYAN